MNFCEINGNWQRCILPVALITLSSCDRYLEIYPRSSLSSLEVFESEQTAEAAALNLYSSINVKGFAIGGDFSVTLLAGLSADELINYSTSGTANSYRQFNENLLVSTNTNVADLWADPYRLIYQANTVIEGVSGNKNLPEATIKKLKGEALFMRAFGHFYLLNLFGEVPLVLSTDYRVNATLGKSPQSLIWEHIRSDLEEAKNLLPADYTLTAGTRIRVTKWAATALLARVFLYMEDWHAAEREATAVINQKQLFILEDLEKVFLKESREAIWQLVRYSGDKEVNAFEGLVFGFDGKPTRVALREQIVDSYQQGDNRKVTWIEGTEADGQKYYFPAKYKAEGSTPVIEYSIILRLAEQYLIRAEARTQQNKIEEAQDDLNVIRARAGLPRITASDKDSLLINIMHERRLELLAEWGHRWFDLKRTGVATKILSPLKPGWKPNAMLYPIPQDQILSNPSLKDAQNPGYH